MDDFKIHSTMPESEVPEVEETVTEDRILSGSPTKEDRSFDTSLRPKSLKELGLPVGYTIILIAINLSLFPGNVRIYTKHNST